MQDKTENISPKFITEELLTERVKKKLDKFWKDVRSFLKKIFKKVLKVIDGIVVGANLFVKKIKDQEVQEICKIYSKLDEHWTETIVTRLVSESEIPKEIQSRLSNEAEIDITQELIMQLQSA